MTYQLGDLVLEGSVPSPRFVNGRLLTAEDLKLEQDAQRAWRMSLGQALEPGAIRFGLDVQVTADISGAGSAIVQVERGLAIGRDGIPLYLPSGIDLELWRTHSSQSDVTFHPRQPAPSGALALDLLVIEPGRADGEHVLRRGFSALPTGAEVHYRNEGVRFALVRCEAPLTDEKPAGGDLPERHLATLQNRVAHLCFGTAPRLRAPWQPLPDPEGVKLLKPQLKDLQVPIALVCRRDAQLLFVDPWPVRSAGHPDAVVRQFQAQVDALRATIPDCASVRAQDHFRYLPPSGWLPAGPGGFQWQSFLGALEVTRLDLDPAFLGHWVEQVRLADPIDLADPPPLWVWQPEGSDRFLFLRRERARSFAYDNMAMVTVSLAPADQPAAAPVAAAVWAADEAGRRHASEPMGESHVIWGLKPGFYTVWAQTAGAGKVGRPAGHHLRLYMGETARLLLRPEAAAPPVEGMPQPADSAVGWVLGPYETLTVNPAGLGAGPLPMETNWVQEVVPDQVRGWLREWGHWIWQTRPDLPVDPGNIRVLRAVPLPAADSPLPPVLAVYGEGGAWLPLAGTRKVPVPGPDKSETPSKGILEPEEQTGAAPDSKSSEGKPSEVKPPEKEPIRFIRKY